MRYLPTPNHSRSRQLPHVNARPWERSRPRSFGFKTHNGAPGYYRDSLRYLPAPNNSWSRPLPHVNARPVGAVSTAKLLIQNPQWSTGLLPRQPAIPPDAEQLAVNTAPTRQMRARGSGLDREAFDPHARRGAGYYRDGSRYLQPPNDSRSRPLPHVYGRRQRDLLLTWLNASRDPGPA